MDKEASVETMDDLKRSNKAAISRAEVAALFGVDPRSVDRAIAAGDIRCVRFGKRVMIPREPLLALLSAHESAGNEFAP